MGIRALRSIVSDDSSRSVFAQRKNLRSIGSQPIGLPLKHVCLASFCLFSLRLFLPFVYFLMCGRLRRRGDTDEPISSAQSHES